MKKVCKIVLIFLIILNLYSTIFNVKAAGPGGGAAGGGGTRQETSQGIWDIGKDFLNLGAGGYNKYDSEKVNNAFIRIVDFLWGLGLLIVIISTVVLGIKYMLVNPNEKSRVKQATTPYIIGVVIIFGAVTIWKFIIDILEKSMLS